MPKHTLGIALRPDHLSFVQLRGTAKSYEVMAAGDLQLLHHDDPVAQLQQYQDSLRELVSKYHLHSDTVIVALPAAQAVLRNLTVPFTDPRRIRKVLKYTLDEHIPFEPDEIVADFQTLPAANATATPLLAAAVQQDIIARVLSLCQAGGLEPTMIDLDVFGLANAALLGTASLPLYTLLLDIQPDRTLLTLLHGTSPVYARNWATGWSQTTAVMETYATRLSQQIQHTIYAYENALDTTYTTEHILLSGQQTSELTGLGTILQDMLHVPTSCWSVTAKTYSAVNSSAFSSTEQPRYAVAFGAALRGLYRQAVGIDLRREQYALHRNAQELRGHLITLGCLLLLVLGLGLGKLYVGNRAKGQRQKYVQQEITRVFRATLPEARIAQPVFQIREKTTEMQNRLRAFGGLDGAQLSVLQTLREISARIPPSLTLNVDALTMTTTTVDLSGTTASYDNVVKLKDALEASPAIATVKINTTTAKTANEVTFQLAITAAKQLEHTS